MTARMHQSCRTIACHLTSGRPNHIRLNPCLGIRPLRRARLNRGNKLLKAEAVLVDVFLVVELLRDNYVHPREDESHVCSRLDRKVILRLAGGDGEPWIGNDDRGSTPNGAGKLLHLRVVHVLANMRADEHDASRIFNVSTFDAFDVISVGQCEAYIAWSAALRKRWRRDIVRSICPQGVFEEGPA